MVRTGIALAVFLLYTGAAAHATPTTENTKPPLPILRQCEIEWFAHQHQWWQHWNKGNYEGDECNTHESDTRTPRRDPDDDPPLITFDPVIVNGPGVGGSSNIIIDTVSAGIDPPASVPEPGSLNLFVTALIALGIGLGWRRLSQV